MSASFDRDRFEPRAARAGTQASPAHDAGEKIDRLYFGLHPERRYRLREATPREEAMRSHGAPGPGYKLMTIARNQGPNLPPARVTVFCLPPQSAHNRLPLLFDDDWSCAEAFDEILRRNGRAV